MAKKKVASEKSRKQERPTGTPPLWDNGLRDSLHTTYFGILKLIGFEVDAAKKHRDFEEPLGIITQVHALCCLLRIHPMYPRNSKFEKWQVAEWRELIENNVEKSKKTIPVKFREEWVAAIKSDLDFLDEFMNRKRDTPNDLVRD